MNSGPGPVAGTGQQRADTGDASLAERLSPLASGVVPGIAAAIVGPAGLLEVGQIAKVERPQRQQILDALRGVKRDMRKLRK